MAVPPAISPLRSVMRGTCYFFTFLTGSSSLASVFYGYLKGEREKKILDLTPMMGQDPMNGTTISLWKTAQNVWGYTEQAFWLGITGLHKAINAQINIGQCLSVAELTLSDQAQCILGIEISVQKAIEEKITLAIGLALLGLVWYKTYPRAESKIVMEGVVVKRKES